MKSLKPFGILIKASRLPDRGALLALVKIHKLVVLRGLPNLERAQLQSLGSLGATTLQQERPKVLVLEIPSGPQNETGITFFDTHSIWKAADTATRSKWERIRFIYRPSSLAAAGAFSSSLLQTHPETGATILRFDDPADLLPPLELSIEGTQEEPDHFLADLRRQLYSPYHSYSHKWEPNDILLADGLSLLLRKDATEIVPPAPLELNKSSNVF